LVPVDAVFFRHHSLEKKLQQGIVVPPDVPAHFPFVVDRLKPPDRGALDGNAFQVVGHVAPEISEDSAVVGIFFEPSIVLAPFDACFRRGIFDHGQLGVTL
jgi:hypothetical protein